MSFIQKLGSFFVVYVCLGYGLLWILEELERREELRLKEKWIERYHYHFLMEIMDGKYDSSILKEIVRDFHMILDTEEEP